MNVKHDRRKIVKEQEPLTEAEIAEAEALLRKKRDTLAAQTRDVRKPDEKDKIPDELDQALNECQESVDHRLRDRNQSLVKKIDKALRRIKAGEYDECEDCGDIIARGRLRARPEASMCISCKEEQERLEGSFQKKRLRDNESFFSF